MARWKHRRRLVLADRELVMRGRPGRVCAGVTPPVEQQRDLTVRTNAENEESKWQFAMPPQEDV